MVIAQIFDFRSIFDNFILRVSIALQLSPLRYTIVYYTAGYSPQIKINQIK